MTKQRDDFAKLDDVSFEMCVRILENYEATREFFMHWIGAFGEEAFRNPDVYDAIAYGYQKLKTQDAKIKRAILAQMKEEFCHEKN